MRLRLLTFLVAAAAAAAAAQAPDPRLYATPASDLSPTAFACTVDTLLTDQPCYFESLAARASKPREQARENARRAALMADDACARAARPRDLPQADPTVLALCRREFVNAAMVCGGEGDYPLLDAENRFSDAAKPCYRLMVEALSKVRVMAGSTSKCCRCLAQTPCGKGPEQCNRRLARGELAFAEKCIGSCADECQTFVPDRGPKGGAVRAAGSRAAPRPQGPDPESSCAHNNTPGVRCDPNDDKHVYNPPVQVIVHP